MSSQNPIRPRTTRRVVLPGLVESDGLLIEEAGLEAPGENQLLVAVEATGISYAEQSMRRGRYFGQPAFPFTPGYDLVGSVIQVGRGGDPSLVGRRVAAMTKTGAWADNVVVDARDSVAVPDEISSEDAEAVTVNGVTAWQMLYRSARVTTGQTILVFGANGGVGGILIQLAVHDGIRVIGAASPRHHDALRAAGVEPVDYRDPDLAGTLRALAPHGFDAVFDNIGGDTARMARRLLAPGGALVAYAIIGAVGGSGSLWPPFLAALGRIAAWSAIPDGKSATFYNLWAGHSTRKARFRRHLEEDLQHIFALLADGTITANIAARFPLSDVAAALELAESRTLNGKVILLP